MKLGGKIKTIAMAFTVMAGVSIWGYNKLPKPARNMVGRVLGLDKAKEDASNKAKDIWDKLKNPVNGEEKSGAVEYDSDNEVANFDLEDDDAIKRLREVGLKSPTKNDEIEPTPKLVSEFNKDLDDVGYSQDKIKAINRLLYRRAESKMAFDQMASDKGESYFKEGQKGNYGEFLGAVFTFNKGLTGNLNAEIDNEVVKNFLQDYPADLVNYADDQKWLIR